jgi:hypothetical protein
MSEQTPEELAAAQAQAAADADAAAKQGSKKVKARVLVTCVHGQVNAVALVDIGTLKADNADGGPHELDGSKAAVAYAESLVAG